MCRRPSDASADVSFYPLTFLMVLVSIALALVAVLAVLFVVLWFAPSIGRRMSETLRVIMTRLMGMILAAIAVAMVIAGLQELIPALRRRGRPSFPGGTPAPMPSGPLAIRPPGVDSAGQRLGVLGAVTLGIGVVMLLISGLVTKAMRGVR